jgi:hypothetical protein
MKLTLKTDFVDFYDTQFDTVSQGQAYYCFNRFTRGTLSRKSTFEKLTMMKEPVIPNGNLLEISEVFWSAQKFVVYLDDYAHDGQDKLLIDRSKIKAYSDLFSSVYFAEKKSTNLKKLVIGNRVFLITVQSDHAWKSNLGNVKILEVEESVSVENNHYPMYSIDYVFGSSIWWAIDLNTAPRLKELNISNLISAKEIVIEIKNWYERLYNYD